MLILMRKIHWLDKNLDIVKGKKILLRASLNVPIDKNNEVIDEFRIEKALKTIKLLKKYADSVFIIAHIGKDENSSLYPVFKFLKKEIHSIRFVQKKDYFKEKKPGVYLFENLRAFSEEKENNEAFAKQFTAIADLFVQDAFSVLHRKHTSVVLLPKMLPSLGGLLLKDELEHLQTALEPKRPAAFVIGGAKFKTKEPLIAKMLEIYDKVLISGALANEALAALGFFVGASKIDDGKLDREILNNPKLTIPNKFTVQTRKGLRKSDGRDIKKDEVIVDAFSPLTFLQGMDFLLWNGPFGWYEKGFTQGTASFINQIDIFRPEVFVGGGDSNAVIDIMEASRLFTFRSTAGGAMLEFLAQEDLPGLEALRV